MRKFLERFTHSEDGAVTVDWVVLTAAVVGLAVVAVAGIRGGNNALSSDTSEYLERQDPQSYPDIQG